MAETVSVWKEELEDEFFPSVSILPKSIIVILHLAGNMERGFFFFPYSCLSLHCLDTVCIFWSVSRNLAQTKLFCKSHASTRIYGCLSPLLPDLLSHTHTQTVRHAHRCAASTQLGWPQMSWKRVQASCSSTVREVKVKGAQQDFLSIRI